MKRLKLRNMNLKRRLLLLVNGALLCALVACSSSASLENAYKLYKEKNYTDAQLAYKQVYEKSKDVNNRKEASVKLAEINAYLGRQADAEQWYKKNLSLDSSNTKVRIALSRTLRAEAKYDEATQTLNAAPAGGGDAISKELALTEQTQQWVNAATRYRMQNVNELNTADAEYAPAIVGDMLYFSSDRKNNGNKSDFAMTGKSFSDIYMAGFHRVENNVDSIKIDNPNPAEGINTKFNDGACAFSADANTVFFTQCNNDNGKGKTCRIFMATRSGKQWSEARALPFASDSFSIAHPFLTKEGDMLYFSSDMPGGKGGKDLYRVSYNANSKSWGQPENLGAEINTDGDEEFPYISADGALYFASNGQPGIGGLDMFRADKQGGGFKKPENMRYPINTSADDFGIAFLGNDNNIGFLSSNRPGGKGGDDIYYFYKTALKFTLSGIVMDLDTKKPLPDTKVLLKTASGVITLMTDADGRYKTDLSANSDYQINATKADDYYLDSKPEPVSTQGKDLSEDIKKDLYLHKINVKDEFTLEGIYYDLDKYDLRPASKEVLDKLAELLKKYPRIAVELGSHTDCRGDSAYNIKLSQERAKAAVDYLVSKGIVSDRLQAHGYGKQKPANNCHCNDKGENTCTEQEYQQNRRTTFQILSTDYK